MSRLTPQRRKKAPLARYANYFAVSHNAVEFLLDFGQYQPETEAVALHSRMACGPTHAKLLIDVLSDALQRFEAEHGPIVVPAPDGDPLEAIYDSPPDFASRATHLRGGGDSGQVFPFPSHAKR